VQAVSAGISSSGVASCGKHFPGHGDTHVDSHLALPTIHKSQADLETNELVPFRSLIKSGIPSIMTAHIALPDITGSDEPASLSMKITFDLLKGELGYHGVVTTDCLEMEAIAGTIGTPAGGVAALQAGADIAMICHRIDRQTGAMEQTYAAVQDGKLSMNDLHESGNRIKTMKDKFAGTWDNALGGELDEEEAAKMKKSNEYLSERSYWRSTALVPQSPVSPLPIVPGQLITLYVPRSESVNAAVDDPTQVRNTLGPTYAGFGEALEKRVGKDKLRLVVYTPESIDTAFASGTVIFAAQNAHTRTWQVDALKQLVAALPYGAGIVLVSTCAPYDLPALREAVDNGTPCASLATFEFTTPAFESAARVLFGEHQAGGKIPVRLP
jgi:beta-N-acetylhexosaminidase